MSSSSNTINALYATLVNTSFAWPHNLAIADEFGTLTYEQLYKQTDQLKDQLLAKGFQQDTHIALITKNNRHFIIGLYASLACGCVIMPLANYLKPNELQQALREAQIKFILTDDVEYNSGVNQPKTIATNNYHLYLHELDVEAYRSASFMKDAAVMRFTSGTTGHAKCVVLSHRSVLERIEAANEGLQLTAHDRVIWVLPMAYHFIVSIMLYVRYGCSIIICNDFMAENILDNAQQHQGTLLYASPIHIRLLAACKKNYGLPQLNKVISTTTAITPSLCKAFEDKFGLPVRQAFGIIEIGLPIINFKNSNDHPEAVGYALPAFTVCVFDDNSEPLPANEVGHLAIKGPGMFDGYLSPPTPRELMLKNGWFITGDLASITTDGLIEIKGRTKNIINVSGNKVFPEEVEHIINTFSGVRNAKVYSQKHILMGEIVAADVELHSVENFDPEILIRHCRQLLSSFKIPQRIRVVDHIEMTASGKVKRY